MPRRRKAFVLASMFLMWWALSIGGMALSVCDYVPPSNQLAALTLSGGYSQFNDRYADNRGNVNNGNLLLKGINWMDGPEWGYRLEGQANLKFSSTSVDLDYSVNSNSDFRRYMLEDIFLFGGLDTSGTPTQAGLTVQALVGGGWGRFQNVSPLAKAVAIVELLVQRGVLTSQPADDAMMSIAQAIGQETGAGLSAVLLKALETQVGITLDLPEVLAVNELLRGNTTRYCGWDATLSLGYEIISPKPSNAAVLRAATNYATAPDPQSQLLVTGRFSAPFPPTGAFAANASLLYTRTLSPTASLSATYGYNVNNEDQGGILLLNDVHNLEASLSTQVDAALSVLFKGSLTLAKGFEEPEWGFDVSFQYNLY